jgi:hypothetical protein
MERAVNSHLESLGRVKLQGILLLAVVFAIGGLAGAALERVRESRPAPPPPPRPGAPTAWRQELHLSDTQDGQIRNILDKNRPRANAILDDFLPRMRLFTDSVRAEVRTVLTPEQQQLFDRLQPPLELEPPFRGRQMQGETPPQSGPPPDRHAPGAAPPGPPPPRKPPPGGPRPGDPPPHEPPPPGSRPGGPPPRR